MYEPSLYPVIFPSLCGVVCIADNGIARVLGSGVENSSSDFGQTEYPNWAFPIDGLILLNLRSLSPILSLMVGQNLFYDVSILPY